MSDNTQKTQDPEVGSSLMDKFEPCHNNPSTQTNIQTPLQRVD